MTSASPSSPFPSPSGRSSWDSRSPRGHGCSSIASGVVQLRREYVSEPCKGLAADVDGVRNHHCTTALSLIATHSHSLIDTKHRTESMCRSGDTSFHSRRALPIHAEGTNRYTRPRQTATRSVGRRGQSFTPPLDVLFRTLRQMCSHVHFLDRIHECENALDMQPLLCRLKARESTESP